ncbi:Serine/threonine protein kinase [Phytophthora megakarya]|uniref:Serine/threonine protein kinase n=1 Tax=Phytophthora megakarya TaxID=4795 RepID=A0A225WUC6_9STRA|nr:Serine/threonine protein kinase [Phytophthora megakarya]
MRAARDGNLTVVRDLVKAGADVNESFLRESTALLCATASSNINIVKFLVNCGADINASNSFGYTPIMCAAERGNVDIVAFLLKARAEVNAIDDEIRTPLQYAIGSGYLDVAQILLENGASAHRKLSTAIKVLVEKNGKLNVPKSDKLTPAIYTILKSCSEIRRFLVNNGKLANIHTANTDGSTALMNAMRDATLGIIKLVLENVDENGANRKAFASWIHMNTIQNLNTKASLMYAIFESSLEISRFLVNNGSNIHFLNNEGSSAFMHAVKDAYLVIIKIMIKHGADVNVVNSYGRTFLMNASECGDMKAVRFLVESGANVNAADCLNFRPINFAARNGEVDVVRFLFDSDADATDLKNDEMNMLVHAAKRDSFGFQWRFGKILLNDLLISAVKCGNIDIVQFLVKGGADVNAVDRCECTPLLHASKRGHWDVVLFLISRAAKVNVTTNDGSTALLYAVKSNGGADAIQSLLKAGADINVCGNNNRTPLIEAAHEGNLAIVQLLVNNGADLTIVDNDGRTALMYVAKEQHMDIIKFLTESGAQIDSADKNGWTALMYAVQSDNWVAVQFLLNRGADMSIVSRDGHTAIFLATTHGFTNIQHLLMQYMPQHYKEKVCSRMPVNHFISPFEVKLKQRIGTKNSGGDYRALWLDAEVVVKLFVPTTTTFAHQVTVWHQLRHPNIIKLYGACDIGHHFFVCEWASNGSLVEYLTTCENHGERRTPWKFLHEAALGLAYLHERNIIHGNLCNDSIVVGGDGLAKLTDFQLSGTTTINPSSRRSDAGFGSFCWQAPEVLSGEAPSLASDIYSFCLCVVTVVTGETPWGDCLDGYRQRSKKKWDAISNPTYCAPVYNMTSPLKMLASKIC